MTATITAMPALNDNTNTNNINTKKCFEVYEELERLLAYERKLEEELGGLSEQQEEFISLLFDLALEPLNEAEHTFVFELKDNEVKKIS